MSVPKLRFKADDGSEFGEWGNYSLKNLLLKVIDNRGKTPNTSPELEIPLIEINAIGQRNVTYSKVSKFVSKETFKNWFRAYLDDQDILFSTVGNTAICSIYSSQIQAGIAQNIIGLRAKREIIEPVFLYYLLTEDINNKKFKSIEMQAVQPSIKVSQMIHLNFLVPCLEEQTKIASFLSAVDEKISQLTQKHALLSQYKQGMMQKLFSQQIRFKADDGSDFGEWEEVRLGNLVDLTSGFAFKSDFFSEDGNKLITPKNFTTTGKANFTDTNTKWTTEISDKKYICRPNDLLVLLTDLTQSCELLGKPILLSQDDGNVLLNQRIVKIIPNRKLEKPFLLYLLLTDDFHELIVSTASGTTVKHSSNKVLQSFHFYLPCLEEQTKIANFLSAIDQKIEVVAHQIEQAKTWKKGLLQQMFV